MTTLGKNLPLIGLTTWRRTLPSAPLGPQDFVTIGSDYVQHVTRAGGIAVLLPQSRPAHAERLVRGVDAVVLIGGGDVDPASYGHPDDGRSEGHDRDVDDFELAVCRAALDLGRPLLAICRGMQVLNVALGGTLVQDLADLTTAAHRASPDSSPAAWRDLRHEVRVEPGSVLARTGAVTATVNSIHHQAVGDLAPLLKVAATAPDGVVEAVECRDRDDVLGVQWHPEKMSGGEALFAWLVGRATTGPLTPRA